MNRSFSDFPQVQVDNGSATVGEFASLDGVCFLEKVCRKSLMHFKVVTVVFTFLTTICRRSPTRRHNLMRYKFNKYSIVLLKTEALPRETVASILWYLRALVLEDLNLATAVLLVSGKGRVLWGVLGRWKSNASVVEPGLYLIGSMAGLLHEEVEAVCVYIDLVLQLHQHNEQIAIAALYAVYRLLGLQDATIDRLVITHGLLECINPVSSQVDIARVAVLNAPLSPFVLRAYVPLIMRYLPEYSQLAGVLLEQVESKEGVVLTTAEGMALRGVLSQDTGLRGEDVLKLLVAAWSSLEEMEVEAELEKHVVLSQVDEVFGLVCKLVELVARKRVGGWSEEAVVKVILERLEEEASVEGAKALSELVLKGRDKQVFANYGVKNVLVKCRDQLDDPPPVLTEAVNSMRSWFDMFLLK